MALQPTLILDAMGADKGAAEMVRGAALACRELKAPAKIVIVSGESEAEIASYRAILDAPAARAGIEVEYVRAEQTLPEKIESPVDTYKAFPQNSVRIAMELARGNSASAVISPGNTGLVMTSALFTLGRVKGVERSPIGTPLPTRGHELFYVDGGSNVDCRPSHLYQFAILAHLYVKNIKKIERPSIALLSNGSEDYKGTDTLRETYKLLKADPDLNFTGYVEGHTLLDGGLDIMICDGFVGNILLKFAEGVADLLMHIVREEMSRRPLAGLAAKLLQRSAFGGVRKRLDYEQFGGAPLLGLKGNVVICHGRSGQVAIKNALNVGLQLAQSDIAQQVELYVQEHLSLAEARGGSAGTASANGKRADVAAGEPALTQLGTEDGDAAGN